MAKKKSKIAAEEVAPSKPTASTTGGQMVDIGNLPSLPQDGRTVPLGISLKESEIALLDAIADDLKVSRHSLLRYGVRLFLKLNAEYGTVPPIEAPPPPKNKVKYS